MGTRKQQNRNKNQTIATKKKYKKNIKGENFTTWTRARKSDTKSGKSRRLFLSMYRMYIVYGIRVLSTHI